MSQRGSAQLSASERGGTRKARCSQQARAFAECGSQGAGNAEDTFRQGHGGEVIRVCLKVLARVGPPRKDVYPGLAAVGAIGTPGLKGQGEEAVRRTETR